MKLRKLIIIFIIIFSSFSAIAQKTAIYTTEIKEYRTGLELFDKQKYGAAQKQFNKAIERVNDPNSEVSVNSQYYAAVSALELFNRDAEHLLTQFIIEHPESPLVKIAYFQLGRYNYTKRKWEKVIAWFDKVDVYDLNNEELGEYYFKLGYAYFMEDSFESATAALYEIKDVDTRYTAPARYYYGHIAYQQGNYQTALETFEKVANHDKFGAIVPYYITQIYYMQNKYDKVLEYAPAVLDSASPKRSSEIARIIGEAYYKTDKFSDAVPYLEKYHKKGYNITPEDEYQLGYAYYKSGDVKEAIKYFKKIAEGEGQLAQTAYYHLADCYLKANEKKYAINAFKKAAEMNFDPEIQEESMFNYAKLSYELSYDPYFNAADAFWEYIEKYPKSEKRDEALGYLSNLYMTAKNYKAAMVSLEAIKNHDSQLQSAYQLVAFNLGAEHFLNGFYKESTTAYKKVQRYPVDIKMNTLSYFWIGENYYRQKNYPLAINFYKQFLFAPRAIFMEEFNTANYNIAYAYFKQKKYNDAAIWFRKYTTKPNDKDADKIADAYLRLGDSYFIQNDYYAAIDYYSSAISMQKLDVDYALYQKAMAQGVIKKRQEKTQTLEKLLTEHSESVYAVDAKYELGREMLLKVDNSKALDYFNQVVLEYPTSSYVKKSLLNIGLIHYNNKENEKALNIFQRIVKDYPTIDDAREALSSIRNIYIDMGNVAAYEEYVSNLSFVDISRSSLDSANYEAAYLQYTKGECENSIQSFDRYLEKFQPAAYSLNANFYRAECAYRAGDYQKAITGYNYVTSQPLNKFTETALLRSATINYQELKQYEDALNNYMMLEKVAESKPNMLEARIGHMRSFYQLKNYNQAIEYAKKVLTSDKIEPSVNTEAHLIIANSALAQGDYDLAMPEFIMVTQITKSEKAAEAQYKIARIEFLQNKLKESEEAIFELVNQDPAYDNWVAKGLILLSDVYVAKGDNFQAKATLQSIIENYEGDDLKSIAQQKLDAISKAEKPKEEPKEPEEIEINYGNEKDLEKLFSPEDTLNKKQTEIDTNTGVEKEDNDE